MRPPKRAIHDPTYARPRAEPSCVRGPCCDPDGCKELGCARQHARFEAAVARVYDAAEQSEFVKAETPNGWGQQDADRPVTMADLLGHLDKLNVTNRQREFIKAAFRALLSCELSVRFNARIDI